MIKTIKSNELSFEFKQLGLLDLGASYCSPCRTMAPIIEEISEEQSDIQVATCDIDENSQIAIDYGVRSVPTFIFFKDGVEIDRLVGACSKQKLVNKINENLLNEVTV